MTVFIVRSKSDNGIYFVCSTEELAIKYSKDCLYPVYIDKYNVLDN